MPNYVYNKITFDAQHSEKVFSTCCPNGWFNFNTLIPMPLNVYRGSISNEDREDFPCNWYGWNHENWGTKWNSSQGTCKVKNKKAMIIFYTAWSQPYPVIVAFANKFGITFEYKYLDEMGNFWGIENWIKTRIEGDVVRETKHYCYPEHLDDLVREESEYMKKYLKLQDKERLLLVDSYH